jgi:RNA polymerase sigma-70 factor (ECF subfamily)
MDGPADHDLMARAAKGDGRAFRTLAERHTGAALRLARRILGNGAMAEDVVQDALLRVWINAPRWRPEAAFRTWLYRIVVNLCLNAKRRAGDLPLDAAEHVADAGPTADEQLRLDERDKQLAAAIGALPERQRAAVVLTYQEGLSNAEAAEVLDTSVSSVETLLVRARRTLRAAFESDHE